MTPERANLDFTAEIDRFDPEEWSPNQGRPEPPVAPAASRQAAAATGFTSREPAPDAMPTEPPAFERPRRRGRHTGRNQQLNVKVRPDTLVLFYALADAHGWGLGETLEHAVDLLEARFPPQG